MADTSVNDLTAAEISILELLDKIVNELHGRYTLSDYEALTIAVKLYGIEDKAFY